MRSCGVAVFYSFLSDDTTAATREDLLRTIFGVERASDGNPNNLNIFAFVTATDGTIFANERIGTIKKGKSVRLRAEWAPDSNAIHYSINNAHVFTAAGLPEEKGYPLLDFKSIEAQSFAATCVGGPPALVDIKGQIDDVRLASIYAGSPLAAVPRSASAGEAPVVPRNRGANRH